MLPYVLIATPRSGSTVIQDLFYRLAKDSLGYAENLYQYFTVIPQFISRYEQGEDGIIRMVHRAEHDREWCDVRREKQSRFDALVRNRHRYLIKFFPSDLTRWPNIRDYLNKVYQPLYIDRRNRIRQFISYTARMQIKKSHFEIGSNDTVGRTIVYDPREVDAFKAIVESYLQHRSSNPGTTIFYEDFMELGGDAHALARLSGVTGLIDGIAPVTIPTPYSSPHEGLIVNEDDWLADRGRVQQLFDDLDSKYQS